MSKPTLMCQIFGHKAEQRPYYGGSYLQVGKSGNTDGIGRQHAAVYARCQRCQCQFPVGTLHLDTHDRPWRRDPPREERGLEDPEWM